MRALSDTEIENLLHQVSAVGFSCSQIRSMTVCLSMRPKATSNHLRPVRASRHQFQIDFLRLVELAPTTLIERVQANAPCLAVACWPDLFVL